MDGEIVFLVLPRRFFLGLPLGITSGPRVGRGFLGGEGFCLVLFGESVRRLCVCNVASRVRAGPRRFGPLGELVPRQSCLGC